MNLEIKNYTLIFSLNFFIFEADYYFTHFYDDDQ